MYIYGPPRDARGNLISSKDPLNHATTYAYNPVNWLQSITSPTGHITGFGYDPNGNLSWRTDGNGVTTNYAYDDIDRLTMISYPSGNITYTYDGVGNLLQVQNNGIGHQNFKDTKWGAFNAVTQYIDHEANYRTDSSKMDSILWGNGAAVRNKAFKLLSA